MGLAGIEPATSALSGRLVRSRGVPDGPVQSQFVPVIVPVDGPTEIHGDTAGLSGTNCRDRVRDRSRAQQPIELPVCRLRSRRSESRSPVGSSRLVPIHAARPGSKVSRRLRYGERQTVNVDGLMPQPQSPAMSSRPYPCGSEPSLMSRRLHQICLDCGWVKWGSWPPGRQRRLPPPDRRSSYRSPTRWCRRWRSPAHSRRRP